jgi:5'(3')-deoxyribonucleotidase
MKIYTVGIDMDGVLADFDSAIKSGVKKDPPEMFRKGFFRKLKPIPGAKVAINQLIKLPHLKLYIASKPSTKNLWSTIEKYQWIEEHFPRLLNRIFLACDKHFLRMDYLIDDDLKRWGKFPGTFLHFDRKQPILSWIKISQHLHFPK